MPISRRALLKKVLIADKGSLIDHPRQTLVCVFLRGGADMLNIVVPYTDDSYYAARPTIGIPPPGKASVTGGSALQLTDFYGFHPKMQPLVAPFKEGRLGIVQAVGTDNPSGSHFDTQDQMEHGEAYRRTIGGGWLGRFLSSKEGGTNTPLQAVAIGPSIPESLRGAPVATALSSVDAVKLNVPDSRAGAVCDVLAKMYQTEVGLLSSSGKSTLALLKKVDAIRGHDYKPAAGAKYPDHSFGSGLREIARLIKGNLGLEVACVDLDGWDTHFIQGAGDGLQAQSIDVLARGLAAFDKDMEGYRDRVTVLVMTEFGRRIYENGSLGTDHGRGFAVVAIGDRINGGKVHGTYPGLDEKDAFLLGPGGLSINLDYRSVLAEVLLKVMRTNKIAQIFPGFTPTPVGLVRT
jgi:uncharacterized protein (DUF1501 family)